MHYRQLLDPGKYLGPQDFTAEREVTIARIAREKMPARDGEPEQSAPMLYILQKDGAEYPRPYKVPKSVMYGLSLAFGTETDAWQGQKIGMYASKCMSFGAVEECLRLRFSAEIDAKIFKWMKKRKASASAYMIRE
jgi:hypothetical protein